MKNILFLFIFSIFTTPIFATYEKGYIDTHGGKKDSLLNNKGFSNQIGILKKEKKQNKEKKFIEIDKIKKIKKEDIKEK